MTSAARDLADRFHERWLRANPFAATSYGIPGYDDLLPDDSEAGHQAWRAEVGGFLAEAETIDAGQLDSADAVTLDCTKEAAAHEVASVDLAPDEYTVTAMQYSGPVMLLAVMARTVLVDDAAAEAYLTRLRGTGDWLDQITERLRAGRTARQAAGRRARRAGHRAGRGGARRPGRQPRAVADSRRRAGQAPRRGSGSAGPW